MFHKTTDDEMGEIPHGEIIEVHVPKKRLQGIGNGIVFAQLNPNLPSDEKGFELLDLETLLFAYPNSGDTACPCGL